MEENAQPAMANRPLPTISVIVPCRNEAKHIGLCLESLLTSDFPKNQLEILVVDGMSDDGTREAVLEYARRYPFLKMVDNPARITPVAMNIGIRSARGELIAIVGAHGTYDEIYLRECVRYLSEYSADQVGGVAQYIPRDDTLIGRAMALAFTHPLGAGANIRHKTGVKAPTWVDTVSCGCYRREVFERVGLFNEQLIRSQDNEFNRRLRRAGGRILIVPTAVSRYYAPSNVGSFLKYNFKNGLWVTLPLLHTDIICMSWRHVVPLAFVTGLFATGALGLFMEPFLWVFFAIVAAYGVANLIATSQVAWREKDLRYVVVMPVVIGMLHFSYGLGALWGVMKLAGTKRFWGKLLRLEWWQTRPLE
jgi:glycosyltransferase involved in cell wall biosynthesis